MVDRGRMLFNTIVVLRAANGDVAELSINKAKMVNGWGLLWLITI